MPADAVIVVVFVLVVGCAAFLFGILYTVARLIGGALRCMMHGVRPRHRGVKYARPATAARVQVCANEQCRKTESRKGARFCSRCGMPLGGAPDKQRR